MHLIVPASNVAGVNFLIIGMQVVQELVEAVILTGRVKTAAPVSLILLADPEQGKTSIVLERPCKSVFPLADVTGKGLQQLCKMAPQYSHFIINDMTTISAKKQSVSQFTIAMLNAMTEEGIKAVSYPNGVETFQDGKRAVIVCLPVGLVDDGRAWWQRSGFMSRMLPFCYYHDKNLVLKIKASIDEGISDNSWKATSKELKIPDISVYVEIPKEFRPAIRKLADHRAKKLGEVGYRRLHQYRTLARGHALTRGWKLPVVNNEDLEFLNKIDPYVNYREPRPLL